MILVLPRSILCLVWSRSTAALRPFKYFFEREPRLLARVDAELLQIMPELPILLDKGNVTFNNNRVLKP